MHEEEAMKNKLAREWCINTHNWQDISRYVDWNDDEQTYLPVREDGVAAGGKTEEAEPEAEDEEEMLLLSVGDLTAPEEAEEAKESCLSTYSVCVCMRDKMTSVCVFGWLILG